MLESVMQDADTRKLKKRNKEKKTSLGTPRQQTTLGIIEKQNLAETKRYPPAGAFPKARKGFFNGYVPEPKFTNRSILFEWVFPKKDTT